MNSEAVPAVASEPPRWNASCSATNAPPCAARTTGTSSSHAPPQTRLWSRRRPCRRTPAAMPRPAPGARRAPERAATRRTPRSRRATRSPRPARRRAGVGAAGKRPAEQRQAADGGRDGNPLPAPKPLATAVRERGEHADPTGRGRLHERHRRERERGDVERPASRPTRKPTSQEMSPKSARSPRTDAQRQRGQLGGRAVLGDPAPVQRERGEERQRQPGAGAHRRSPWNGRYASAASAAIPTRGRSRRRS